MSHESRLETGIEALGLASPDAVPSEVLVAQLLLFLDELAKWNRVYNLTRVDEQDWVSVHILDSLSIGPYLTGDQVADIGSGGGFPGVPLAILYPQKHFTLVDSNGKKTRFLEHVRMKLKLHNVSIVQSRAEALVGEFDHVTCRAFASLAEISALTAHLLKPGASVLAMKGEPGAETDCNVTPLVVGSILPLSVPGVASPRSLVIMKRPS